MRVTGLVLVILKSLGHNNKVQLKMFLLSSKALSDGRRNVFNITTTRRVALTGSFYLKMTCMTENLRRQHCVKARGGGEVRPNDAQNGKHDRNTSI